MGWFLGLASWTMAGRSTRGMGWGIWLKLDGCASIDRAGLPVGRFSLLRGRPAMGLRHRAARLPAGRNGLGNNPLLAWGDKTAGRPPSSDPEVSVNCSSGFSTQFGRWRYCLPGAVGMALFNIIYIIRNIDRCLSGGGRPRPAEGKVPVGMPSWEARRRSQEVHANPAPPNPAAPQGLQPEFCCVEPLS